MRLPRETCQIQQATKTHLPHLSRPQSAGLALWVCGAILAGSACQNAVASALSPWRKWNNLRLLAAPDRRPFRAGDSTAVEGGGSCPGLPR